MLACETNAQKLQTIFEKVIPDDDANWLERYKKAAQAVSPHKKRKVEDLMREMLEKLQLLHSNQFFKAEAEKRSEDLEGAIQQLSILPPSLPDEEGQYSHSGSGSIYINPGSGTQRVYSVSGGSGNKQYNAETQNFGRD